MALISGTTRLDRSLRPVRREPVGAKLRAAAARGVETLESRLFMSATDLDAGFGQAGRTVGTFGDASRFADVKLLPDGKLLAVGTRLTNQADSTGTGQVGDFLVARFTPAGQLDTTFGKGAGFVTTGFGPGPATSGADAYDDSAAALVVLPDGDFVVAGTSRLTADSTGAFAVARYNADGTPDTAFSNDGETRVAIPGEDFASVAAVTRTAAGKILVAGTAGGKFALAQLNPDGTPDASFGTAGVSAPPYLYYSYDPDGEGGLPATDVPAGMVASDVEVLPDGKILVGGTADVFFDGGINHDAFALARYLPNGSLDANFGDGGFVTQLSDGSGEGGELAVQPDGRIVMTGSYGLGVEDTQIVRYTADGVRDNTFGTEGAAAVVFGPQGPSDFSTSVGRSLVLLPNKQVLSVGTVSANGTPTLAIARLGTDGQPDTQYGTGGKFESAVLAAGEGAVLQPDGKLVVVGSIGSGVGQQAAIVRFQSAGTASVSGTIYNDANQNGGRDAGEGPLANWTAYADLNNNGSVDAGEPFAVTGTDGAYTIGGLLSGTYRIREIRQDGWTRTQPAGAFPLGYYDLALADGQGRTGNDFGNYRPQANTGGGPVSPPPPLPNVAPTALADAATTGQDTPVEVDVLANDTDDNALNLGSVTIVAAPANGTTSVNSVTGRVTYTPAVGFGGTDSFTYTVKDDKGLSTAPTAVTLTVTPAALGGTATANLPASVIGGQKTKAAATVAVTNKTAGPVNGPVAVSLVLSEDGTWDAADPVVTGASKTLKLAAGRAKTLKLKLGAVPNVKAGTYNLLARVTAPDGTSAVAPAGTVAVAAPFVDLTATVAAPAAGTTIVRGGRAATLSLLVVNTGNIAVTGTTTIKVYASADGTLSDADRLVATAPAKLKLAAGRSKTYKVKVALPPDLAAGPATLIAVVDPDGAIAERNDNNNSAASGVVTVA